MGGGCALGPEVDLRVSKVAPGVASAVLGIPLALNGIGCNVGGVFMVVIGNRKVPAEKATVPPSRLPAITLGPQSALLWTF